VSIKNFPHPSLETESTIGRVAPVFIMASLMFNVVLLLQNVVRGLEHLIQITFFVMIKIV
jgi:hypothetical protein